MFTVEPVMGLAHEGASYKGEGIRCLQRPNQNQWPAPAATDMETTEVSFSRINMVSEPEYTELVRVLRAHPPPQE